LEATASERVNGDRYSPAARNSLIASRPTA